MESVAGFRVCFTAQFLEQRELKLYRCFREDLICSIWLNLHGKKCATLERVWSESWIAMIYIMPKSGFSLYRISLVIATGLYVADFQNLCWLDQYSWLVAIMLNLSCCITDVVGGMMDALIDLVHHYQTQKYITQVYFILVLFIFPQHCLMRLFWQELVYSSAFCY